MASVSTANIDSAVVLRCGGAVHPRPEAHELAGHRVSGVRWAGAGMLLATLATLAFMGARRSISSW